MRRGGPQIGLGIRKMRNGRSVCFLAGHPRAPSTSFLVRLLLELRAQFAFFHFFDRARYFLFVCLSSAWAKLLFKFLQARSLPLRPFRPQLRLLRGEFLRGEGCPFLEDFEFIAAAVQVSNQRGGLVRFWGKLGASPVDDVLG